MCGVFGDQRERENNRDVVFRLLGQDVAAVEFPEVGVTGALDSLLHVARTAVVGGHGEIPVAKLSVEISQVMGSSARGFLRVLAIVNPHAVMQTVTAGPAAHELPDAASADARNG